jgi:hypothetical protein
MFTIEVWSKQSGYWGLAGMQYPGATLEYVAERAQEYFQEGRVARISSDCDRYVPAVI